MTKIKICGLKRIEDVEAVNQYHPDYAGFIIDYPQSFRSTTEEEVKYLTSKLDSDITSVGVFVNAEIQMIINLLQQNVIDAVQLHGEEDDTYIKTIQEASGCNVIKAFILPPKSNSDNSIYKKEAQIILQKAYKSPADIVLLDAGRGSGRTFAWELLQEFDRPYILAGGLNETNIVDAITTLHPEALDVSSAVETNRQKDPAKIKHIIELVRKTAR